MRIPTLHPVDELLLLFMDGELPRRRAERLRAHLGRCAVCRERQAQLQSTLDEVVRLHQQKTTPGLIGARSRLQARLAEAASGRGSSQPAAPRTAFNGRRLACAAGVAALILLGVWLRELPLQWWHSVNAFGATAPLPNPRLTPGSARLVALSTLCSAPRPVDDLPVPGAVRQQIFSEYGIRNAPTADYQIDYLIAPGLGGTSDIRNLWPEPRFNTRWNAAAKDQLEGFLHQSVCSGKIPLTLAQQELASNWISAYARYFHIRVPLVPAGAPTFGALPPRTRHVRTPIPPPVAYATGMPATIASLPEADSRGPLDR